eukprot:2697700-Prymnesium_polylepis.2
MTDLAGAVAAAAGAMLLPAGRRRSGADPGDLGRTGQCQSSVERQRHSDGLRKRGDVLRRHAADR